MENTSTPLTSQSISDFLNSIRTRPIEHVDTLEQMLKDKSSKSKEVNNAIKLLNVLKNKPLSALRGSDLLRELSQLTMENLDQIQNEDDLKVLASQSFHGYDSLHFFTHKGKGTAESIITSILLDAKARTNFFENESFKLLGVLHNDNVENSEPLTVLIVADEIQPGPLLAFDEKFLGELNKFRENPSSIVKELTDYKNNLKKFFASSKRDLIKEVEELIKKLKDATRPLPKIEISEGVTEAAVEYFDHLEQANVKNFFSQDEEYLQISLTHYISGFKICKEFINTTAIRSEALLIDLLVSEGDKEKESMKTLRNDQILYVGLANGVIRGKHVTIVIFTDEAKEAKPKTFLEEINNLRAHPKSYMKYIQKMIDEANYPEYLKKKTDRDSYMQNLYQVLKLLGSTRTFGPFAVNEELQKAAETRLDNFIKQGPSKDDETEDLIVFLSDFGSAYNYSAQISNRGIESPKDLLIFLLTSHYDVKRMYKSILFSKNLNFIGIAQKSESSMTVALFTDNFDPNPDNLKVSVLNHKRRLNRPDLTEDELLQIHKDFKLFDTLNTGFIKPEIVLLFMNSVKNYAETNPVYYDAVQLLNTYENNANGVDVEEFANAVRRVFRNFDKETRWDELFTLYTSKKSIDFNTMKEVTTQLGYRLSDEQIEETMAKLNETSLVDKKDFTEIMNLVERSLDVKSK